MKKSKLFNRSVSGCVRSAKTLNHLRTAKSKFVFNFNKQEVQNVIENMGKRGKLISATITLPKVGQTTIFLPTYSCEKALGDVVPLKHDQKPRLHGRIQCRTRALVWHRPLPEA